MTSAADFTKSAFWVRKMQRIFTIVDVDKDGVFSSEDWDKYMQYAMNQKQLTERQYQRFTKLFQKLKSLWIPDGSKTLQEHFPSCCVAVVTQGTCNDASLCPRTITLFSSQTLPAWLT